MKHEFFETPPTQRGEKLVDGINYISIRFDLMQTEITILNDWLKRSIDYKTKVDTKKLSEAETNLSESRDLLTDSLIESAQLIKKLQNEITNKGIIGDRNSGVENKA